MKYVLSLLLMMALFATSCVNLDFDEPPTGGEPVDITTNATLNDLKAVFVPGTIKVIEDDLIIKATVIADDASGNFYKTLVIQDETGGIELKINAIGLYNQFPIGREIFIRAKGLSIGDYNGLLQFGGGIYIDGSGRERIAGIEETLISKYLSAGERDQFRTPTLKSINSLTTNDLSTLIRLENVQFTEGSTNKQYADSITRFSVNHNIEDCNENELILRTSGYADFATKLTQSGNGTLTGVLGVFGSDLQLFIRNTADVNMNQNRCNDEPVDITPNATLNDLKAVYVQGTIKPIEADLIIKATIIADDASGNFFKTLVIQDETGGIELKINAVNLYNQFPIGREIFIHAKGLSIGDFNGLPQLGGGIYLDGSGNQRIAGIEETLIPTYISAGKRDQFRSPVTKSINSLTTNDLSTLIKLEGVQFTDGSVSKPYANAMTLVSVNHQVEDCNENELILRTSGYADFASALTQSGNGTLVGVLGVFGPDLQLFIRNTADVNMTQNRCNGGGGGGDLISENFESVGDNKDVNLVNWINIATQGTRVWRGKTFGGNTYVQATAFQDTAPFMEAWLITPAIDLATPKTVRFRTAQAFWQHGSNPIGQVLISTNFNGGDPSTATWVSLNPKLATSANSNYDWVDSGLIDLSGFSGSGHIAFKYNGSGPGGVTSTFILDDVVVENK